MTVKELASKMNEIMREEKGDYQVLFTQDGILSFPIRDIKFRDDIKLIILDWNKRKGLRAPGTAGFTKDSNSNSSQED